jgi:glutamate-ammonia-ligase adenylyltransferase
LNHFLSWYLLAMRERISAILSMNLIERASALSEMGFGDGRLASHNIDDLSRLPQLLDKIPFIIESALDSPNPDSALNFLERFLSASVEAGIDLDAFSEALAILIKVFGSGEFLSSILIRKPQRGLALINSPYLHREKPLGVMRSELEGTASCVSDYNGLLSILRLYKQEEILRIGARDLLGYGTIEEITGELSSLASASLDAAHKFCLNLLKKGYGTPYCMDEGGNLRECGFVVLGMGKLGGNELNFSSDIDLIYLYTSDEGEVIPVSPLPLGEGRGEGKTYTLYEFYCKLAELVTKAISSSTEDGFVFRVDLRLRPDGQNGPIVNSLRSAELYYESWGETWERAAMLKARPVAGDIPLGERFLKEIEPFIYRRYLDFGTIEDIKEMKLKIDRELALKPGMWDVKLGSGGIREIEFLVQATQLIYAGKERSIRERNTLKSLQRLEEKGLLPREDCETLTSAYGFLRTVEHRIQVESERQTHRLPTKAEDLKRLAKRCGFKDIEEFKRVLESHSRNVERLYDGIFHEPSKRLEEVPPEVAYLFEDEVDRGEVIERLSSMGFEDPEAAYRRLQTLREAEPSARLTQRSRTILRRLAPHLFLEASRSPDPDMAIVNLERFLNAMGAKGSFYSLLSENPKMVRFLSTLFGTSDFLSQFLISHPELLDNLLRSDTVTPAKGRGEMRTELNSAMRAVEGYEEVLDAIRRFRNIELIRIGINDIAEEIGLLDVFDQLTSLAEISIEEALGISEREVRQRCGVPTSPDGREAVMSVIGMGKLGGREMNYSSDLDLIFIYSGGGETKGPKVITNQEYFAKVAQRVISFLTLQTREGFLYNVDTRLRPSGSAGALVSSLDAFRRYHRESARLWERQALIKARFVAGDGGLGEEVTGDITSFVYGKEIDEDGRKEMVHLRDRMEKELAKEGPERYNVKTGRGGIVDIEFTVQFLQLRHGSMEPALRKSGTLDALQAIFDAALIAEQDYKTLRDAYIFLMKAENRLRILHNISTDQMDLEDRKLSRLAKRLGYHGDEPGGQFLRDYQMHTERVRGIYNRLVSTPGSPPLAGGD